MVIETWQTIDSLLVPHFTHNGWLNASIGYAIAGTRLVASQSVILGRMASVVQPFFAGGRVRVFQSCAALSLAAPMPSTYDGNARSSLLHLCSRWLSSSVVRLFGHSIASLSPTVTLTLGRAYSMRSGFALGSRACLVA
jgi:hypothetical protein